MYDCIDRTRIKIAGSIQLRGELADFGMGLVRQQISLELIALHTGLKYF